MPLNAGSVHVLKMLHLLMNKNKDRTEIIYGYNHGDSFLQSVGILYSYAILPFLFTKNCRVFIMYLVLNQKENNEK